MSAENLCRLCLKSSSKTVPIFSSDIPSLIETLTCVKVQNDDGLPGLSCEDCISDLYASHKVRNRIIESDNRLRNNFRQVEFIKIYGDSIDSTNIKTNEYQINFPLENDSEDDRFCTDDFDDDYIKNEYDEEDEMIDNLIEDIKDENPKDYIEEINVDSTKFAIENQLELAEIDNSEHFNIKVGDRNKKSSEDINLSNVIEDIHKDFVVLTSQSDIIEIVTFNGVPKYSCKICKIDLESHKVSSHKSKHIKAKCKICDLIVRADHARKHLNDHTSNSAPQVCSICGTSHKNKESLRIHEIKFHKNKPCHKCTHCDEEFRISSHLWVHIRRVHTGDRPFQCKICGKAFFEASSLKRHNNLVHLSIRAHPCEICKVSYSTRNALVTHTRQHTGELPFICEICARGFRQGVTLRNHLKSKHNIVKKVNTPKNCSYTQHDRKKQLNGKTEMKK